MTSNWTELHTLAKKWAAGKGYAPEGPDLIAYYSELFQDRRDTVRKVLEIGIGYPECMSDSYLAGSSLFMWREYFPNAEVYALDNKPEIMINQERIHSFVCDQSKLTALKGVMPSLGKDFDLIVDDGSHLPEHQILTANTFMPLLATKGVYCIEDIWLVAREQVFSGVHYKSEFKEFLDQDGAIGDLMLVIKEENQ